MMLKHLSTAVLAFAASPAFALSVPAGCAAPGAYVNQWYVDPVNGSDAGDGSQAHPWLSLQHVIDGGKIAFSHYKLPYVPGSALLPAPSTAVVHAGDVIWLASGNHGAVSLRNAHNSGFITLAALPGATPAFTSVNILGASFWALESVTVSSLLPALPAGASLVGVAANGYWGPAHDVVISGNTLYSQPDTSAWGPADWRANAASGISVNAGAKNADGSVDLTGANDGQCFTVSNNHLTNVQYGIVAEMSDRVLIDGNTVNQFSGDGIDFGASDLVISGNVITDSVDTGNDASVHRDGMQGQPYWGDATSNHDVTINGNTIIAQVNPNLAYPACMQGISVYNGHWSNVSVTNNFVVTNLYNGLVVSGTNGLSMINNTVLSSAVPKECHVGAYAIDSGAGAPGKNTDDVLATGYAWIGVLDGLPGNPTLNAVVRNNIASSYNLGLKAAGVPAVFDHNIVVGTQGHIYLPGYAQPAFATAASLFTNFHPATFSYDATPVAGSPAIGAGTTNGAPLHDIKNAFRPTDAGAFAH